MHKKENPNINVPQLIRSTIYKYNNTIHSFIEDTPSNVYIGETNQNLSVGEVNKRKTKAREKIINLYLNKNEKIQDKDYPAFEPGSYVFEKTREISKRKSRFKLNKILILISLTAIIEKYIR